MARHPRACPILDSPAVEEGQIPLPEPSEPLRGKPLNRGFSFLSLEPEGLTGPGEASHETGDTASIACH